MLEYVQANLIWVSVDNGGHSKVAGVDGIMTDLKLKVAPIVEL